ncbi:hypothetical protein Tco_0499111 [Tanacetum coccineum]
MRTRSQSRNLHHQQHQAPPPVVEPLYLKNHFVNPPPPVEESLPTSAISTRSFYDEVPERPEYVDKAYAFPIFPRGGSPDLVLRKNPLDRCKPRDDSCIDSSTNFSLLPKNESSKFEIRDFNKRFDEIVFMKLGTDSNVLLRAMSTSGFSNLHQID